MKITSNYLLCLDKKFILFYDTISALGNQLDKKLDIM